jgi:threonine dehydratase
MAYAKPSLTDIFHAQREIKTTVRRTPTVESPGLTNYARCGVKLKLECLQVTGSFKIRGATNKVLSLSDEEKGRGVITISSGNHGRAVAYVAGKNGIPAVVCVSETVPESKITAIQELGAEVVTAGKTYDEANEHALHLQKERGLTMVHPFDDPLVIAGQGTIGLELMEEMPEIDTVIVPLSGGGLLGGIAIAVKSINPKIQTVGVSMDRGPAMIESIKAGKIVEVVEEPSLADALIGGLGAQNLHTFNIIREKVDQTVVVSEEEIAAGMTFALEKEHLVVEGGGAVGIAALLASKVSDLGEKVVVVISGSNVSLPTLLEVGRGKYPYQVGV